MSSITYRIATGAQAAHKVVTLQTISAEADVPEGDSGKIGGFSLHAGVTADASKARSSNVCAAPSRVPAMPKFHSRTPDPRRNQRLRDHRLLARLFKKRAFEVLAIHQFFI